MKKGLLIIAIVIISDTLLAQVPQGFNYQAIARDASGNVIANQLLPFRITIQSSLTGGTIIWEETHSVTTNDFGIMTLVIGDGNRTGGTAILFSDINWGGQPLFLKTEVDTGAGYIVMGTSQLWSVPYAMVASNLNDTLQKLIVKGETEDMEEALFEVKNKDGQTVFAVYNDGVRIYVDDVTKKGAKGGFAVGGFGGKKGTVQNYLVVKPDSVRIYIDDTPGKGAKGGFAVGGFGTGKGLSQHLFVVSPDSIRAYIDTNTSKGAKGGFAVGGFGTSKGLPVDYMVIKPDSTNFYVRSLNTDASSTFNILGIDMNLAQTSLLNANVDTINVFGVMNVQNNLIVNGNIDVAGIVNQDTSIVVDIEGNTYKTVLIGTQLWFAENLNATKYNDGTPIPNITDNATWAAMTTGAYCNYDNNLVNSNTYGKLYNNYVAASTNPKNVCPIGWHVFTHEEWTTMENYLIDNGFNYDGTTSGNKIAKSLAATKNWASSTTVGVPGNADYPTYRNKTGFTALPGGRRYYVPETPSNAGEFMDIDYFGFWWCSDPGTPGLYHYIYFEDVNVTFEVTNIDNGYSIRCIKDI